MSRTGVLIIAFKALPLLAPPNLSDPNPIRALGAWDFAISSHPKHILPCALPPTDPHQQHPSSAPQGST